MEIRFCSSVLFVKDINVSRNFYEEFLQQKVEIDYGENIGFVGGFAIWQMEHAYGNIFRNSINRDMLENKGHQVELYFETDDIEAVYTRLSNNKVEMVHDMFEQPWGQRVFRVYDPDRHIVELGEPMSTVIKRLFMSGMAIEEVSERTFTPLSMVQKEIESIQCE